LSPQQALLWQSALSSQSPPFATVPPTHVSETQTFEQQSEFTVQEPAVAVQQAPQSTGWLQLLVCGPHLPEQVTLSSSGTQQTGQVTVPPQPSDLVVPQSEPHATSTLFGAQQAFW
jgi:hypothetical protein